MILVDYRAGSKDLIKGLVKLGLPVENADGTPPGSTLEFGDVAFMGRGVGGAPLFIGIEHKKVADLIQSLEGRLPGHQLPGMHTTYDRSWLIVEGDWAHDAIGRMTMFKAKGKRKPVKGAPPALELEKRLLTLETRAGLHIRLCPTQADSLRFICALYRFWTDKDIDEHKSHIAIYSPDLDAGLKVPMSEFRRIIAGVPAIGLQVSKAIEQRVWDDEKGCGSFRRLMMLTEAQLAEITTVHKGKERRLGTSKARQILEALR